MTRDAHQLSLGPDHQCGGLRSLGKTHLGRSQGGLVSVRGVLQVHSAPPALCPHIEWAVAGVLGVPVSLPWVSQPAAPGVAARRAELAGPAGHGGGDHVRAGRLEPAALRGHRGGQPGLRRGPLQLHARARHVLGGDRRQRRHRDPREPAARGDDGGRRGVRRLARGGSPAGEPWDDELEPFRCAAEGAPVLQPRPSARRTRRPSR